MVASPATSVTSTRRQIPAVAFHRLASHPAVTSFALSIATVMATTATGAPAKSTTMPLIENHAAQPASPIATMYASMSAAREADSGSGLTAFDGFTISGVTVALRVTLLRRLR